MDEQPGERYFEDDEADPNKPLKIPRTFAKLQRSVSLNYKFYFACVVVVLAIFVYFGYKLYQALSERERKREEKKRQKQQKKRK